MAFAAEQQQYERAAVLRDKVRAIERTMESQKMAAFARTELDLVAMARRDDQAAVQLFVVRNGKMLGRDVFFLDAPRDVADDEVLGSFLLQYYARATSVPREVLVPRSLADTADLEAFLAAKRGTGVRIRTPQRGEKRELMELAARNAAEALAREPARWLADEGKTLAALEELADALGLPARRCGSSATTSPTSRAPNRLAAWSSSRRASRGRGSTAGSRSGRSRVRTTSPATRRSSGAGSGARGRARRGARRSAAGRCPTSSSSTAGAARSAPRRRSCSTSWAWATCRWRAWRRSARSCSCRTARTRSCCRPRRRRCTWSSGCATRRTASRSPTTANLRNRRTMRSAFDDLPGVGPKRKRELLKVFGSIKRVRDAPVEQIAAVPGIGRALAERIKAHLEA